MDDDDKKSEMEPESEGANEAEPTSDTEPETEKGGEVLEDLFGDEHAQQLKGLGIEVKADEITKEQITYLLDHYPFIQILNSDPKFEDFEGVKVSKLQSTGWSLHDLGDALSSSPGEKMFAANDFFGTPPFEEEGGSNGGGDDEGGTIYKISYQAAAELVGIARERWDGIYIVAGSPYIKWCVWAAAELAKVAVYGYEPEKADKDRQARLARYQMQKTTSRSRSRR